MSKSIRKEEFIVCAAVRFYRDEEDDIGVVVMGLNCDDIEDTYVGLSDNGWYEVNEGFMTSKGNFVNKYEALEITGWKNKLHFKDKDHLTPEDLIYFQSLIY